MNILKVYIKGLVALGVLSLLFTKMKISGKTALVVGDSHSAGFGWGWQDVLARSYNFKFINIAKSGYSIPQMQKAMVSFFQNAKEIPFATFIYGGANDIYNGKSVEETLLEMQEMVNKAVSYGSRVVVIAGFRSAKVSAGKDKTFIQNYDTYKQRLSTIQNATIVPIWEGGLASDSPDGFHLRADAQKRFADYIGKSILSK